MLKRIIMAVPALLLLGSSVLAEDCAPTCDYHHDYGPYNFSYVRPGLVGYPICDQAGNCLPYLTYVQPGRRYGQITIRPVVRHRKPHAGTYR
jgi:hypothetical protein